MFGRGGAAPRRVAPAPAKPQDSPASDEHDTDESQRPHGARGYASRTQRASPIGAGAGSARRVAHGVTARNPSAVLRLAAAKLACQQPSGSSPRTSCTSSGTRQRQVGNVEGGAATLDPHARPPAARGLENQARQATALRRGAVARATAGERRPAGVAVADAARRDPAREDQAVRHVRADRVAGRARHRIAEGVGRERSAAKRPEQLVRRAREAHGAARGRGAVARRRCARRRGTSPARAPTQKRRSTRVRLPCRSATCDVHVARAERGDRRRERQLVDAVAERHQQIGELVPRGPSAKCKVCRDRQRARREPGVGVGDADADARRAAARCAPARGRLTSSVGRRSSRNQPYGDCRRRRR